MTMIHAPKWEPIEDVDLLKGREVFRRIRDCYDPAHSEGCEIGWLDWEAPDDKSNMPEERLHQFTA